VHPYVRSGLMTLGVVGAVTLIVIGVLIAEPTTPELPAAIESIVPGEGALISPQGSVGADLADDHTGVLIIDGAEVPLDQLTIVEPLGQIYFSPGADQIIPVFDAGTHRVSVVYWPKAQTRADATTYGWQFRVGS